MRSEMKRNLSVLNTMNGETEGSSSVCLSYVDYLYKGLTKDCLSVLLRSQYEGWNNTKFVRLIALDPNMKDEMKRSLYVCLV